MIFLAALRKNQRSVMNMVFEFMMKIGIQIIRTLFMPLGFIARLLCKFMDVNSCIVFVIKALKCQMDKLGKQPLRDYNIFEKKILYQIFITNGRLKEHVIRPC